MPTSQELENARTFGQGYEALPWKNIFRVPFLTTNPRARRAFQSTPLLTFNITPSDA